MAQHATIDRTGRLVIPKSLRQHYGLHEGSRLVIEARSEGVLLRPLGNQEAVQERDGLLLATGTLEGDWPDHRDLRSERIGKSIRGS